MLTGRPVRYLFGREEEMQYGPPRGAERIYVKDGVMRDGRIVARKIRAYFDSGAYTRLSSYAVVKCAAHLPGPYTIPNVYGDVYCVFTNRTPATAMRGFGVTGDGFRASNARWTSSPISSASIRWSSASSTPIATAT